MKLPTRLRIRARMARDWWYDLLAVLSGDCNDCPVKTGLPDETGYRHWRCALRRGHDGAHRYRNYVWDATGRCEYEPVDHCPPSPRREVSGAPTRAQLRAKKEWLRLQSEKRAAARKARREGSR